jgi:hypothetical protein
MFLLNVPQTIFPRMLQHTSTAKSARTRCTISPLRAMSRFPLKCLSTRATWMGW